MSFTIWRRCNSDATRDGLSKNSDVAKDWKNDGKQRKATKEQATSYRSLIITGPSEKGQQALAKKINGGEKLEISEDLDGANWSVMSSSSPAGYIYPSGTGFRKISRRIFWNLSRSSV